MPGSKSFSLIIKILFGIFLFLATGVFLFFSITTAVTKNTDSYEYELPFKKGEEYRVSQGYGGLFTHRNIAAIDFAMPAGTPVCAAREGTVHSYKSDSDEGGISSKYKNKSNYVIIKHDDGSFGCYWHLQKDAVFVKRGRIQKGQQIGLSGATGQVLRPHLHFSVKSKLTYDKDSFRKTKFKTTIGTIFLKQGTTYKRPAD